MCCLAVRARATTRRRTKAAVANKGPRDIGVHDQVSLTFFGHTQWLKYSAHYVAILQFGAGRRVVEVGSYMVAEVRT
jgi:hypothetical protein